MENEIEQNNMKNEDGRYNQVGSFEEAKKVMQDYSPQKTEFLKKMNLERAFIGSLCGIGATGGLFAVLGVPASVLLPASLIPVGVSTIHAVCNQIKANKKNKEIASGDYFEGKREADIIYEANKDYVGHNNFMRRWDEITSEKDEIENGRSR